MAEDHAPRNFTFEPNSGRGAKRRREARHAARYSRVVGWAKLALPTAAGALVVCIAAWPYLSGGARHLRQMLPAFVAGQVQDLRMLSPRFSGVDKEGRPFVLVAQSARQNGGDANLLALESPKASVKTREGAWMVGTADTGIYQSDSHRLDLLGHVVLFQDKGYLFHTGSASVDLDSNQAAGQDKVVGNGPGGTIVAEGFTASHNGDSIIFTGHAQLTAQSAAARHP